MGPPEIFAGMNGSGKVGFADAHLRRDEAATKMGHTDL